jgi:hypothetical protein
MGWNVPAMFRRLPMNAREVDVEQPQSHTIVSLLKRLTDELSVLFRQEMALASAEFSRSMKTFFIGLASVTAGGAVLFAGFLVLLAAAVLGLAEWLEPWQAALVVGIAVALVGVVMLLVGRKKLDPGELKPERAVRSLKRDKDVLVRRET